MILTVFKLFIEFSESAKLSNAEFFIKGYLCQWKNTEFLMWETINLWISALTNYQKMIPMLLEQITAIIKELIHYVYSYYYSYII
jgi:hypothetical protein